MATSKFNKVVQKNNITYTNLNMRNATNGFKTRKHVYRYAKKSLIGGSAGSAWRAEVYKRFIDNVAQLIPDTKAQAKVSSDEFNTPITINNTQFPNNIILYAFIIFYCLKVHNFKINTTEDGTKNTGLLIGLVNKLIEVLKNVLDKKQLTILEKNTYDATVDDNNDKLFKILNSILHNCDITNALVTVKVEHYFTIEKQKKSLLNFRGSKRKINSITINVEPKKKFVQSPVAINFNTAFKQSPNNTHPHPDVVATSSAKNDDTTIDNVVDKMVATLNKILTELNIKIPTIDIPVSVDTLYNGDLYNNSICSIFCNDVKNNERLRALTREVFNKLIDERHHNAYYNNTIAPQTQPIHAQTNLSPQIYASICNYLLNTVLKTKNGDNTKTFTFTQMKANIKENRDMCDGFTLYLGTQDCKNYINKMYSECINQLDNHANKYETYKAQIDKIIQEDTTITQSNIASLNKHIVECILNSYLMRIMYCCIIFYAIMKYMKNKERINFNQPNPIHT